jgi:DNA sulfur modification protein DndE
MKLSQIKFENRADVELKALKARTGITPNVLCRIGFCLSVEDPSAVDPNVFPGDSTRIIDRHVLLGPYDNLLVALMKERLHRDGLDPNDEDLLGLYFRAHVHRGIHLLFKRAKKLGDIARLVSKPTREAQGAAMASAA